MLIYKQNLCVSVSPACLNRQLNRDKEKGWEPLPKNFFSQYTNSLAISFFSIPFLDGTLHTQQKLYCMKS